jgi:hypothetical protein
MQPDLRDPRVGDRVVIHANCFPDQPEPLDGEVLNIGTHIDTQKSQFTRQVRFYVLSSNKQAKWLDKNQFNLNPNTLK